MIPDIAWALQERDCKGADSDTKEGHLTPECYRWQNESSGIVKDKKSSSLRGKGTTTDERSVGSLIAFHTRQDPCSSDKAYALENSTPQANAVCYENHPNDSRVTESGDKTPALTESMGTGGGNVPLVQHCVAYPLLTPERREQRQQGKPFRDKNEPMFTLNSQDLHGVATNMSVRRLTPKECERLQGFPDNWTKYGIDENGKKVNISDTQRYKMMGNAITVSVSEWIGKRINNP